MKTTTNDGKRAWRTAVEGGHMTNVRAICACGRTCECAGDERCNACQAKAAAALKEHVRMLTAEAAPIRAANRRAARAAQKDQLGR